MKNLIVALAVAVFALTATAGEKAPVQAPVKPVAKAEACTTCTTATCKTVEVARKATLRERRNLVVVEKVPVVEVKKVEVVKAPSCDCAASCSTAARPARRLLGGVRNRAVAVVDCATCK
jgi:hypothetical protein